MKGDRRSDSLRLGIEILDFKYHPVHINGRFLISYRLDSVLFKREMKFRARRHLFIKQHQCNDTGMKISAANPSTEFLHFRPNFPYKGGSTKGSSAPAIQRKVTIAAFATPQESRMDSQCNYMKG